MSLAQYTSTWTTDDIPPTNQIKTKSATSVASSSSSLAEKTKKRISTLFNKTQKNITQPPPSANPSPKDGSYIYPQLSSNMVSAQSSRSAEHHPQSQQASHQQQSNLYPPLQPPTQQTDYSNAYNPSHMFGDLKTERNQTNDMILQELNKMTGGGGGGRTNSENGEHTTRGGGGGGGGGRASDEDTPMYSSISTPSNGYISPLHPPVPILSNNDTTKPYYYNSLGTTGNYQQNYSQNSNIIPYVGGGGGEGGVNGRGGTTTNDATIHKMMEKINYMNYMLQEMKDEKVGSVVEDFMLYGLLGVFVIFICDSFSRSGKYTR